MARGRIQTGNRGGENSRYTYAFGVSYGNLGLFEKPVSLAIPVTRSVNGETVKFSEVYTIKENETRILINNILVYSFNTGTLIFGDDYRRKINVYKQDGKYYVEDNFDAKAVEREFMESIRNNNSKEKKTLEGMVKPEL